jgi:hypothetical protein
MIASTCIGMLTIVPAIIASLWENDIATLLSARGLPLPDAGSTRQRLPRLAVKMFVGFISLVLIGWLLPRP